MPRAEKLNLHQRKTSPSTSLASAINGNIKTNNDSKSNGNKEKIQNVKEKHLLNSFLDLESKKLNVFVKQNNVRIKKLLPALERFYTSTENQVYICKNCNIEITVTNSFLCPECSDYLYYNL